MRAIKIRHGEEEFFVVDARSKGEARTVTLLITPGEARGFSGEKSPEVPTNEGGRIPAARWCGGRIEPLLDLPDDKKNLYSAVIQKYLSEVLGENKTGKRSFYYNKAGKGFHFSLSPSHPHGLAVNIYSDRARAEEIALADRGSGPAMETARTNDLAAFLTRAAEEGYAGAILDDMEPIYFCTDADEAIHFLKISLDEDEEGVEESLLGPDGHWSPRAGEKDLELYVNQDACDRNMVRLLGKIPFYRKEEPEKEEDLDGLFLTVEETGRGGEAMRFEANAIPRALPGGGMAVLFHGRRSVIEFMAEQGQTCYEIVAVSHFKAFLEKAARRDLLAILEPANHRASGGVFWLNKGEIIFDSFSGFWKLDEEKGFVGIA